MLECKKGLTQILWDTSCHLITIDIRSKIVSHKIQVIVILYFSPNPFKCVLSELPLYCIHTTQSYLSWNYFLFHIIIIIHIQKSWFILRIFYFAGPPTINCIFLVWDPIEHHSLFVKLVRCIPLVLRPWGVVRNVEEFSKQHS